MIGSILTLGLGSSVGKLITLGYGSGAPVVVTAHHGADDDYHERFRVKMARRKMEEETIIKVIVNMVTNGTLQ
jgi:precorrin-4 methylase